jgi:predicted GNAT family acetyltransferase
MRYKNKMSNEYPVNHNTRESRFETTVDGRLCVAEYRVTDHTMHMTHTYVPPPLEGRGIAAALVAAALDHARAAGLKVAPHCSYVRAYMKRRPATLDLMAP